MQEGALVEAKERGISIDDVLQKQRTFRAPRLAFEGHFENGEQFLYGALNIFSGIMLIETVPCVWTTDRNASACAECAGCNGETLASSLAG